VAALDDQHGGEMMRRVTWWFGVALAVGGGVLAVVICYAFTGWLLVRPQGTTVTDYAAFVVASASVAAVGALPGLVLILVLGRGGGGGRPE
jgi:hypothetical protein